MSLTDKVIKNTFYFFASQVVAFVFPFLLVPFIIGKIGTTEFGIYTIAFGFIGALSLFDFGVSTSYIKFISEYYNKKETENLNSAINVGVLFYLIFTLIFAGLGYLFVDTILHYINIAPELIEKGRFALRICLVIFVIATNSNMFVSILISLQKMYLNSILNMVVGLINFILTIILLYLGYGLKGLLYCQLITFTLGTLLNIIFAKIYLPEMTLGVSFFRADVFKKMMKFGMQMYISKLAGFFSEKYDEFLLSVFTTIENVTFFNLGSKIMKMARLIPSQFLVQVAPVASELNAKEEKQKLKILFGDTLRYLSFITIPLSVFVFIFSDEIIFTWMGGGFEISSHILRILIVAMLVNFIISSPGNSILPNIGIPKYQMHEGIIHFVINVILSYILIRSLGLIGAAYGNSLATIISSIYVFIVSVIYFKGNFLKILSREYLLPLLAAVVPGWFIYWLWKLINSIGINIHNRPEGIIFILITSLLFLFLYIFIMLNTNYLDERNKLLLARILLKIIPKRYFKNKKLSLSEYNNEFISIVIITYNKLSALKLCTNSLLETIKNVNCEVIIWNNNSNDGTDKFLRELSAKNNIIKVITNDKNIGNNAKSKALEFANGDFIIGIDDDVIKFPENWIFDMVRAYKSIPYIGYLVADVVEDDKTNGAKYPQNFYIGKEFFDKKIIIESGPVGGWCFMISRNVYKEVGKLLFLNDRKFVPEDSDYQIRISNSGFTSGILKNTKVYHATGEYYNNQFGNPYEPKYTEAKKPLPVSYKISRKLRSIMDFKGKLRIFKRLLIYSYYE